MVYKYSKMLDYKGILKHIIRCCIGYLLIIVMDGQIFAQSVLNDSTVYLTVDNLFNFGKENSLQLKGDKLSVDRALQDVNYSRNLRLPEISVNAAAGYIGQPIVFNQGLASPTYPEVPHWSQNYGVQISQPIYQGGKLNLGIKKSQIQKEIEVMMITSDWNNIKLQLLEQYLILFNLYKQRDVLERDIEEAKSRQRDIHNMYKEGLVTSNDEIRGNLQLTQRRLDLDVTKDNIRMTSLRLDVLLGIDQNYLIMPDTLIMAVAQQPLCEISDYITMANSLYPEIQIAGLQNKICEVDVKLAKAEYLPNISLSANYTLARPLTSSMEDKFAHNWNIGVDISFPVSSFYRRSHNVRIRELDMNIRQNEMERLRQTLTVLVNQNYTEHQQARNQVKTLELAVQEAKENYRVVRNRYMNQLSILTDLLDAETVLLDTELQLTNAKVNVIFTYYKLMQACGKI